LQRESGDRRDRLLARGRHEGPPSQVRQWRGATVRGRRGPGEAHRPVREGRDQEADRRVRSARGPLIGTAEVLRNASRGASNEGSLQSNEGSLQSNEGLLQCNE